MKNHTHSFHKGFRMGCAMAWLVLAGALSSRAQMVEVRIATILPKGLGQANILAKLGEDWRKASGGTVDLHRAPGGEKDGEAGIVKKLRSGNYQAGLLSAVGLAEIEPEVTALQHMPLIFRNWEEVDFVREKIRDRLEERLRAKGFVPLFWADSGWVMFFSVKQAATPAEFKRMKLFSWAGDTASIEIMKSLGYQPVAMETDHIHTSFASGLIDAAPVPPAIALGGQIQTVAPHALDLNWAPIVGAAIIRKDVWDKISPELQKRLLALCEQAGSELRAEGRRFHNEAVATLRNGPNTHVNTPTPEQRAQWEKLAQELSPRIRGRLVPAPIHDEVCQLLESFRAHNASAR